MVELVGVGGEVAGTATTGEDGGFRFAGVPAGNYTVQVTTPRPSPYLTLPAPVGIAAVAGNATAVSLKAKQVHTLIDWTTLDLSNEGAIESNYLGEVKGKYFPVKTWSGASIQVFWALPVAQQDRDAITNTPGLDIRTQCHGYAFGAMGIQCNDQTVRDFFIIGADQIISNELQEVAPKDAPAKRAAKMNVYLAVYNQFTGGLVHTAVVNTMVLDPATGAVDAARTIVSSKSDLDPIEASKPLNTMGATPMSGPYVDNNGPTLGVSVKYYVMKPAA